MTYSRATPRGDTLPQRGQPKPEDEGNQEDEPPSDYSWPFSDDALEATMRAADGSRTVAEGREEEEQPQQQWRLLSRRGWDEDLSAPLDEKPVDVDIPPGELDRLEREARRSAAHGRMHKDADQPGLGTSAGAGAGAAAAASPRPAPRRGDLSRLRPNVQALIEKRMAEGKWPPPSPPPNPDRHSFYQSTRPWPVDPNNDAPYSDDIWPDYAARRMEAATPPPPLGRLSVRPRKGYRFYGDDPDAPSSPNPYWPATVDQDATPSPPTPQASGPEPWTPS
ncbi:hypothetical protein OC842_007296, partial [Tilletia horrida]